MADKPKYQHELAERLANIAKVLSCEFPASEVQDEDEPITAFPPAILFMQAFWETMCREWSGIDRLRLNKFYYLMQQFIRVGFELVQAQSYDFEFTSAYFALLQEYPLKYPIVADNGFG